MFGASPKPRHHSGSWFKHSPRELFQILGLHSHLGLGALAIFLSSCSEQGGGGDEVLKQPEDWDSEEPGGWGRWSTPFFSITVITALMSHLPEFPAPSSPGPTLLRKLLDRVLVLVHWEAEKLQTDSPLLHLHQAPRGTGAACWALSSDIKELLSSPV